MKSDKSQYTQGTRIRASLLPAMLAALALCSCCCSRLGGCGRRVLPRAPGLRPSGRMPDILLRPDAALQLVTQARVIHTRTLTLFLGAGGVWNGNDEVLVTNSD